MNQGYQLQQESTMIGFSSMTISGSLTVSLVCHGQLACLKSNKPTIVSFLFYQTDEHVQYTVIRISATTSHSCIMILIQTSHLAHGMCTSNSKLKLLSQSTIPRYLSFMTSLRYRKYIQAPNWVILVKDT